MEPFRCRGVLFWRNIEGFRHKTAGALPHIFFVEGNTLHVRGSLDKRGLLGRTMDWFRVK